MASPVQYAAQIFVLAVWITCAGMSVTGLAVGWPALPVRIGEPAPIQAEMIETQMQQDASAETVATPDITAAPSEDAPPEAPDLPDLPPLPELPAFVEKVAPVTPQPKPQTKVQRTAQAHESNSRPNAATGVQNLTMGVGEGRQPAPDYPREALSRHQEGTVIIQFMVGVDGQVLSAEVWQGAPWPLLNDAALRTVRGRWHFAAGAVRLYRVPVRFRIQ